MRNASGLSRIISWPGAKRAVRILPARNSTVRPAASRAEGLAMGGGVLVKVDTSDNDWQRYVQAAARLLPSKLYVLFKGGEKDVISEHTLNTLAELYDAVIPVDPVLDVVPLMPCAGWLNEAVATIPDLQSVAVRTSEENTSITLKEINSLRTDGVYLPLSVAVVPSVTNSQIPERTVAMSASSMSVGGESVAPQTRQKGGLQFSDVAVGGTFDHLHAGHRLLLASTALVTTGTVWLGIASDELLANKENADQLEIYETREQAAIDFLKSVRPRLNVRAGPLTNPSEPPLAATKEEITALVVSQETTSGATWICNHRKDLGLSPISVVIVGLVGGDGQDPSSKLSSSTLREAAKSKA